MANTNQTNLNTQLTTRNTTKNRTYRFETWNARSLKQTGAVYTITDELTRYGIDIAAVQVTRLGDGQSKVGNYIFLHGGAKNSAFGTGFIINTEIAANIKEFRVIKKRMS